MPTLMLIVAWIGMVGFWIFGIAAMSGIAGAAPLSAIFMGLWISFGLLYIGSNRIGG